MNKPLFLSIAAILSIGMIIAQPSRVQAIRTPIVRFQPDGDSLVILLRGDEHSHFTITEDGWQVKEDDNGYTCYAIQKLNGNIVASRKKAHNAEVRTRAEQRFLKRKGICKLFR